MDLLPAAPDFCLNMADAPTGESIAQCLQYTLVGANVWVGPQGEQLSAWLELHCKATNTCHLGRCGRKSHIPSEKHKTWVELVSAG